MIALTIDGRVARRDAPDGVEATNVRNTTWRCGVAVIEASPGAAWSMIRTGSAFVVGSTKPTSRNGHATCSAHQSIDDAARALGVPALAVQKLGRESTLICGNTERRHILAIRDAIGISPLYYRVDGETVCVSTSLEWCRQQCSKIDEAFVGEFIATGGSELRTMWSDVRQVPPGHLLRWRDGNLSVERYWFPAHQAAEREVDRHELATQFRELLEDAVLVRMDSNRPTWAHLSGGLDSSSVVSLAASVARHSVSLSLGGTVTFRNSLPHGDETAYANTVIEHYNVKNVLVEEYWPWKPDETARPYPLTDAPSRDYPYYSRDKKMERLVTEAGGTVILSGAGGDQLFPSVPWFISDCIANGRVLDGIRACYEWCSHHTNISFWRELFKHAEVAAARNWWSRRKVRDIPTWLTRTGEDAFRSALKANDGSIVQAERGHVYDAFAERAFRQLGGISTWMSVEAVEIRHPFLDVGLVEFVLATPARARTTPVRTKPLLRDGMVGTLPAAIRERRTKGGFHGPPMCFAFRQEATFLKKLLEQSRLAALNLLEPRQAAAALVKGASGADPAARFLYAALSLETWLWARARN